MPQGEILEDLHDHSTEPRRSIHVKNSLSTKAPILRSKLCLAPSCCQSTLCKSCAIQSPVLLCFAGVPGNFSNSTLHKIEHSHTFCPTFAQTVTTGTWSCFSSRTLLWFYHFVISVKRLLWQTVREVAQKILKVVCNNAVADYELHEL